ncbi:MAG: MlaD family protein [Bacteroidota bacterium]
METKELSQHIRLGMFVLVGITLFIISVFFIGSENNIFSRTFTLSTVFKNVEGLKEGDNVWLSGVKIGTVNRISITSHGRVVVTLSLKDRENKFIRKDATAFIGSDGLVGNKIVIIRPGNAGEAVHDEDTINSTSPADTQELINIAKEVGENTRALTVDLKAIAQKVSEGRGVVGELLNDGVLAQDLRKAITSFKSTGDHTAKAALELNSLLHTMQHGDGLLPALIADTSYARAFQQALTNVKKVSDHTERVTKDLEKLTGNINKNDNALGVLLNDSITAQRLQATILHAERASKKLDENMEALQHNFFLRGYFRKKDKREEKKKDQSAPSSGSPPRF